MKNVPASVPATSPDPARKRYEKGVVSTIALMRIYVETLNTLKAKKTLTTSKEDDLKLSAVMCRKILVENFDVPEGRVRKIWEMLDPVKISSFVEDLCKTMTPNLIEIPGEPRPDSSRKLIVPWLMVDPIMRQLQKDKGGTGGG